MGAEAEEGGCCGRKAWQCGECGSANDLDAGGWLTNGNYVSCIRRQRATYVCFFDLNDILSWPSRSPVGFPSMCPVFLLTPPLHHLTHILLQTKSCRHISRHAFSPYQFKKCVALQATRSRSVSLPLKQVPSTCQVHLAGHVDTASLALPLLPALDGVFDLGVHWHRHYSTHAGWFYEQPYGCRM